MPGRNQERYRRAAAIYAWINDGRTTAQRPAGECGVRVSCAQRQTPGVAGFIGANDLKRARDCECDSRMSSRHLPQKRTSSTARPAVIGSGINCIGAETPVILRRIHAVQRKAACKRREPSAAQPQPQIGNRGGPQISQILQIFSEVGLAPPPLFIL
jgi:hypothetical protein